MKTKTVDLYVDLYPGWHERPLVETYLSATTNPPHIKAEDVLRVKITVDLPHHSQAIPHDDAVRGEANAV